MVLKMSSLAEKAIDGVKSKDVALYPSHTEKTYLYWMENIKDWCVSRQLWWGHRIPAWYDSKGNVAVCKSHEEAVAALELLRFIKMKMLWILGSVHGYGRIAFSLVIRRKRLFLSNKYPSYRSRHHFLLGG